MVEIRNIPTEDHVDLSVLLIVMMCNSVLHESNVSGKARIGLETSLKQLSNQSAELNLSQD